MNSELKAAADLVRRVIQQCDEAGTFPVTISAAADNAAWKLARACLAEHPADNDEPITDSWLRKVCDCINSTGDAVFYRDPESALIVSATGGCWIADVILINAKTRGDVRMLCKVLGVALKGDY